MADTNFVNGTVIVPDWLNDVNGATYKGSAVFTPAGIGAVARTMQSKLRDVVSITDFGASTTATRATNTAAFNAALAAANTVTIPEGTFEFDDTINVPDYKHIIGAGKYATILKFYVTGDKDGMVIGWCTTLENMTLRSEAAAGGMKGTVRLQSLTNPNIPTNVGGNNWTDPAIGGLSYRNTLRELVIQNGQNYNIYGLNLGYTIIDNVQAVLARGPAGNMYLWGKGGVNMPYTTTVTVSGGEYTASYGGPGINLENVAESLIVRVVAEGNFSRGILLNKCSLVTLQSPYVENNFALGASKGDGDIVAVTCDRININNAFVLGNNSFNAVTASGSTFCTLASSGLYLFGGSAHTTSLDSGWVVSSTDIGIVEYGEQSGGRWVKYSDGTCTYSKKVTLTSISISSASGSVFVQSSPQSDTDFPNIFLSDGAGGFVFSPAISVMSDGGAYVWALSGGSSKTNNAIRYRLASTASQASVTVDVYITLTGRWK